MTSLFWVRSPNFGDSLNPILHKAMTGKDPIWSDPEKVPETVIAIGSLAHTARPYNILWGCGAMADDMPPEYCNKYTVARAVRGPLTAWLLRRQGVDISNAIFADPAILIPRYFPMLRNGGEKRSLVVPNYVDKDLASKYNWGADWDVVSPMKDALALIQQIASADTVITSSLHTLIVAEAYNVPAVWVEFSDNVRGGGFKFADWYLATIRNPPKAIQIRGNTIPWDQIFNSVYEWSGSRIDLAELGNLLLEVCPFA